MKNLKDKIESRRQKIDEESGFGSNKPKKMKGKSYEEDFDDMVSVSELESKLDQLKLDYKKARSEDEKMKILKKQTEVRAKLQMAKEDD